MLLIQYKGILNILVSNDYRRKYRNRKCDSVYMPPVELFFTCINIYGIRWYSESQNCFVIPADNMVNALSQEWWASNCQPILIRLSKEGMYWGTFPWLYVQSVHKETYWITTCTLLACILPQAWICLTWLLQKKRITINPIPDLKPFT